MIEHDHELDPTCAATREEFSALLDDELSPSARLQVEAHLAECSDCLRALDAMKRVSDLYATLPAVSAPADFEARLREAVRPNVAHFPRNARMIGLLALAAAAGLALMVLPYGLRAIQPQRPVSELAKNDGNLRDDLKAAKKSAAAVTKELDAESRRKLESLGYTAEQPVAAAPVAPEAEPAMEPTPAAAPPTRATGGAAALAPARRDEGQNAPAEVQEKMEMKEEGTSPQPMTQRLAPPPAPRPRQLIVAETPAPKSAPMPLPAPVPPADVPAAPIDDKSNKDAPAKKNSEPASTSTPALQMERGVPAPQPVESEAAAEAPPTSAESADAKPDADLKAKPVQAAEAHPDGPVNAQGQKWRTAQRDFTFNNGVWEQATYDRSPARSLPEQGGTYLVLVSKYPELKLLSQSDVPVIFKAGDKWYKFIPAKK